MTPMETSDVLRLVVVDAQLTFAEALAARLDAERDMSVIATLASVDQLWAAFDPGPVDLLLLGLSRDAGQEDRGGLAPLRQVIDRDPRTRIVVMSEHTEPWLVAEAIEAGVSGWVPKDLGVDRLLATIRGVCREETWIPADVLTGVLQVLIEANDKTSDRGSVLSRLTPRERDVLQCIVDGLSRNEIAERLFLSPNTVRTHVQHVLRKLGVHSALNAAALARSLGLERVPDRHAAGPGIRLPAQSSARTESPTLWG